MRVIAAGCSALSQLTLGLVMLASAPLTIADTVTWQGYKVYYTTLSSTLIPQSVAQAHHITRSNSRIVTNITLRRDDEPAAAIVTGIVTNLLSQQFPLGFVEVREPGAIYYLVSQIIDERDTLRFDIDITPVGHDDTYHLTFTRQYHSGAQ